MYLSHLVIIVCAMIMMFNTSWQDSNKQSNGREKRVPKADTASLFRRRNGFRSSRNGNKGYSYRSYRNVIPSGRIVYGSSPYTRSTWQRAAVTGLIFGGLFYQRNRWPHHQHHRHPIQRDADKPTICTNNYELRPNSSQPLGYFVCPLFDMPDSCEFCCGEDKKEYCCNYTDAQVYYGRTQEDKTMSNIAFIVIGIIAFLLISLCIYLIVVSRRGSYDDYPPWRPYPEPPEPYIYTSQTIITQPQKIPMEETQPQPKPFKSQSLQMQSQPKDIRVRQRTM